MAHDPEQVQEWALVLASQGIPYTIHRAPDGWTLIVDPHSAAAASDALQTYVEENAAPPIETTTPVEGYGRTYLAVVSAGLLFLFFIVTGPWSSGSDWFGAGAADAALIREGELWRTLTALTLHVDFGHVFANAVSLALFGTAVMITVGPGVGLWLVLLSGATGNFMTALLRPAGSSGVGASTAIFGAVGILAGLQFAHGWQGARSRAAWTPIIAGVLLFVLLGTAEHTDILAHLLGLVSGIAVGAAWSRLDLRPSRRTQWVLTVAASLTVAACWWVALHR